MSERRDLLRSWRRYGLAFILLATAFAGAAVAQQPPQHDDLKREAFVYYYQNFYQQDLEAVGLSAQSWLQWRAFYAAKSTLVLDIDETSLSNWPRLLANDFGNVEKGPCRLPQGPCGRLAWDHMAVAKPIKPTLDLFHLARSLGVSVFFITGRGENERAATEKNLRLAGYVDRDGSNGWVKLYMRRVGANPPSAADFKAPDRATIASSGYTIIANVGDQESDLAGGYAERAFKLPNPFYYIQ